MRSTIWGFIVKHWDALLASVIVSTALYFLTRHSGIGISPDAVEYTTVAENIRWHGKIADFNGTLLVDFPAGYPSFLAMIMLLTGRNVLQFAPVLNCLLFSGILFMVSRIIRGYRPGSSWYKLLFLLALVSSRCMLQIYSMLWSETVFIFLSLLFMIALHSYLRSHSLKALLQVSLIAAIALATRYAAVTLLGMGSLLLLLDSELPARKKIKHLFLLNGTGISLLALNLLRNRMTAGTLIGVRENAIRTFGDNLNDIGVTVSSWLPFLNGHEKIAILVFVLVVAFACFMLLYRFLQQQFFPAYETIVAGYLVVYAVFILAVSTWSRFEELNSRLLSPMYIPLLLVGTSWVVPLLKRTMVPQKLVLLALALAFYAGLQLNHYKQNAEAWVGIGDSGIPGYTEDDWTRSETVLFIKQHKNEFGATVFANANDAVYFLTGIHAHQLPHKDIQKEIDKFLKVPSFYVVFFTDGDNPDLVGLDFIRQHRKLSHQQHFNDGSIYYFF